MNTRSSTKKSQGLLRVAAAAGFFATLLTLQFAFPGPVLGIDPVAPIAIGESAEPQAEPVAEPASAAGSPPVSVFECTAHSIYLLSKDATSGAGVLSRVDVTVPDQWLTVPETLPISSTDVNALALMSDGRKAIAITHNDELGGNFAIVSLTPDGEQAVEVADLSPRLPEGFQHLDAGAVSPKNDLYYSGGYQKSDPEVLRLHAYDLEKKIYHGLVADIALSGPSATTWLGADFAFGAQGNLFVIGASQVSETERSVILVRVPAASVPAAEGSPRITASLVANLDLPKNAPGLYSGVALSADGLLRLQSGTGTAPVITTVDLNTGAFIGCTEVDMPAGTISSDLGSCGSPSTIEVSSTVSARGKSGDQFTMSLRRSDQGDAAQNSHWVSTTGAKLGPQAVRVPQLLAVIGKSYTIEIAATAGSGAEIADYRFSYRCLWQSDGESFASGAGISATLPAFVPRPEDDAVDCTFDISPLPPGILSSFDADETRITKINPNTGSYLGHAVVTETLVDVQGVDLASCSQAPTLELRLDIVGRVDPDDQFTASVSHPEGASTISSTISTGAETGEQSEQIGLAVAVRGVPYSIKLEAVGNTSLANYQTSYACHWSHQTTPFAEGEGTEAALPVIAAGHTGEALVCVLRAEPKLAQLTLETEVAFGDANPAAWILATTGSEQALPGPTGVSSSVEATAKITPGVAYQLSQSGGPATYLQQGWNCRDEASGIVPIDDAEVITLTHGVEVTCTVIVITAKLTLLKAAQSDKITSEAWNLSATPQDPDASSRIRARTVVGSAEPTAVNTIEVLPNAAYALREEDAAAAPGVDFHLFEVERLADSSWVQANPDEVLLAPGETAVYRFLPVTDARLSLPHTGGASTDMFVILGSGLLLISLGAAGVRRVRWLRALEAR